MIKLTAASARDLQAPGVLRDHAVRGLQLHAKALGKSWFYYYRDKAGKQRKPRIGAYPAISLDAARDLARAWALEVAAGGNPSVERQDYRGAPTVAHLLDVYMRDHARVYKADESAEADERNARNHILPVIGAHKLQDVTLADVNRVLTRLGEAGKPVMANRVRVLLHKMFEVARANRWTETGFNPAEGAVSYPEFKRRRKVEPHEFEEISKALDALELQHPRHVAAIRCILLAGSRVTELCTAPLSALRNGRVTLKRHKTERTGDEREIFLPSQALAAIEALADDGSGLIFGRGVDRWSIRRVWIQALERAGMLVDGPERLRPQDLRRTFASVGISSAADLDAIGQLFGHKDPRTTRGYAWLYSDAKRERSQEIGDKLSGLMKPPG